MVVCHLTKHGMPVVGSGRMGASSEEALCRREALCGTRPAGVLAVSDVRTPVLSSLVPWTPSTHHTVRRSHARPARPAHREEGRSR
jgi:hypothetical protein